MTTASLPTGKIPRYFSETCFSILSHMTEGDQLSLGEERPKSAMDITLSEDQEKAYDAIKAWIKEGRSGSRLLSLVGFAGSGKSTVVSLMAAEFAHLRIAFCALTGKAAGVLRKKMRETGRMSARHQVSTMHSLLYNSYTDEKTGELRWYRKESANFGDFDFVVIDEASMVSESLLKDLQDFGVRILAVGDHGQLPPVGGSGSLMANPDLRLETIHRQALGNPILELSAMVRKDGRLPKRLPGADGDDRVLYVDSRDLADHLARAYKEVGPSEVATLCWMNRTRGKLNQKLRKVHHQTGVGIGVGVEAPAGAGSGLAQDAPARGDQVICLKNAYRLAFNGMRGFVEDIGDPRDHHHLLRVAFRDDNLMFRGPALKYTFGADKTPQNLNDFEDRGLKAKTWEMMGFMLDWGYALTVHKAQGSQFHTVAYVVESIGRASQDEIKRHIYTGITRSSNRLLLVL